MQVRSAVAVACAEKNVPVGHVADTGVVHCVWMEYTTLVQSLAE